MHFKYFKFDIGHILNILNLRLNVILNIRIEEKIKFFERDFLHYHKRSLSKIFSFFNVSNDGNVTLRSLAVLALTT